MRSRIFMMLAIPTAFACGDTKTSSRADDTAMNTSDAADGESDGNPSEDAGAGDDEGTDTGDSESGGTDDGSVDDGGAVEDGLHGEEPLALLLGGDGDVALRRRRAPNGGASRISCPYRAT